LGLSITFGTDRCHVLDDPWQDGALPLRRLDLTSGKGGEKARRDHHRASGISVHETMTNIDRAQGRFLAWGRG
jgi:hypothetical protein